MKKMDSLTLVQPTHESASRTVGPYYFLVLQGAMSYTAFQTKFGFLRWLTLRGLELTSELVPRGTHATQRIKGHFFENMLPLDDFRALESQVDGDRHYKLHNGDYVPALAYVDGETGSRVIAYPHTGLADTQPKVKRWYGLGVEEGVVHRHLVDGDDWLFESPGNIVDYVRANDPQNLTELERSVVDRAFLETQYCSPIEFAQLPFRRLSVNLKGEVPTPYFPTA